VGRHTAYHDAARTRHMQGTPAQYDRYVARRAYAPTRTTRQDSMHKLIMEIRSASEAAQQIPRSNVAATLRRAEAAHRQTCGAARRRWSKIERFVLRPLRVRQFWHAAIAAVVGGAPLLKPKPQWAVVKAHELGRLTLNVDEMIKTIQPPRPRSGLATRRTLPLAACPEWTGKWDTHKDRANY